MIETTESPEVERRRDIATAQFKLRIAEATANRKTERFAGDKAAATKHAEELRAYIASR